MPSVETSYDKNQTIHMIGMQRLSGIITDENLKQIDDVAKARPYTLSLESALNMFILGYINGKRAERKRRKSNQAI